MACIFCGSKQHDYRSCTILYNSNNSKNTSPQQRVIHKDFKQNFFGKAPNVFIGKFGYPNIRVGILGAEDYNKHDDPLAWSHDGTSIPEIISLRSQLVNSHFKTQIKSFNDKFSEIAKEVSLAKRPVDIELNLEKKPHVNISFNNEVAPHGPSVGLQKASITENVHIDTKVDKATSATDMNAGEAIHLLASKGIDEHYLTRAFSMGNFGIPIERKLVPTRWSITAVDDIRGKQLLDEIKKFNSTNCELYIGGYLGNNYLILFFDDVWQYELFEQYVPTMHNINNTPIIAERDYEPYEGRHDYVHETAGGYYAARIGILEHLTKIKKQSSVLAIRIITEEYTAPLGVWVVREAVRKTLQNEVMKFPDRDSMLKYARNYIKDRFKYDTSTIISKSELIKLLWGQRKLKDFS